MDGLNFNGIPSEQVDKVGDKLVSLSQKGREGIYKFRYNLPSKCKSLKDLKI